MNFAIVTVASIFLMSQALFAQSAVGDTVAISARSKEVLASYEQTPEFLESVKSLKPTLRAQCESLLQSQLRLLRETDSWKLYSLYEMLASQRFITSPLVRVPTVTQLSDALPKYTSFRLSNKLVGGSLVVTDVGSQCGPDPLSIRKGAYFMNCGEFMIGSGLIRTRDLKLKKCLNVRLLNQR